MGVGGLRVGIRGQELQASELLSSTRSNEEEAVEHWGLCRGTSKDREQEGAISSHPAHLAVGESRDLRL